MRAFDDAAFAKAEGNEARARLQGDRDVKPYREENGP